jgi:protein tyrosine/serine phosphatase
MNALLRLSASFSLLFGLMAAAVPSSSQAEIVRFRELEPGKIYRGGQPETLDDYLQLEALGVRTIINMKTTDEEIESEREQARAFGIQMISRPISPVFGLSDEALDEIQSLMRDPSLQPVFIHCRHGKDRTGLMAGVYRVEQQGWTPDAAYAEMRSLGFNPWLVALRHRFWDRMSDRGFGFAQAALQN